MARKTFYAGAWAVLTLLLQSCGGLFTPAKDDPFAGLESLMVIPGKYVYEINAEFDRNPMTVYAVFPDKSALQLPNDEKEKVDVWWDKNERSQGTQGFSSIDGERSIQVEYRSKPASFYVMVLSENSGGGNGNGSVGGGSWLIIEGLD